MGVTLLYFAKFLKSYSFNAKNIYTMQEYIWWPYFYHSFIVTMQPHLLINKLNRYDVHPSLQLWIWNFLTNRTQYVKASKGNLDKISINTGGSQGCVLSAFLFIVYTTGMRSPNQNSHIKYADDTVILGLIDNDIETPYFDTINYALQWCKANHLDLNVTKTKEIIHDFGHTPPSKQPITISISQ